jgi:catechol 2,3-dioxygenase-like lactoylglutathione lyase family enzyme
MSIRRVVPNINSNRFDENREFYVNLLGFQVVMDLEWIMTLASPTQPIAQISVVRQDKTAPVHPNLTVEVDDVDAIYAAALERSLTIVYPLTDEDWGVRRFFVLDPNGQVVNVMSHRH